MHNLKSDFTDALKEIINEKIKNIQSALDNVIESKNSETKSSAGDKFETGRAMMQREQDQLELQLHQAIHLKKKNETIPNQSKSDSISFGSLVFMNSTYYFLSVGLGKIKANDYTFYSLSVESPIGRQLIGMQEGDSFIFNNKNFSIDKVI